MFEAIQERPQYWDGMPYDRHVTLPRGSGNRDWIQSWHHVARTFPTLERAEAYARRILAQRPGCPVEIRQTHSIGRCVATVSRDALGRVWTDLLTFESLL